MPVNDAFFSEMNPLSAYVFGLWSADGYMYIDRTKYLVSITLKGSDSAHVERIAGLLGCTVKTATYNGFARTTLRANSERMYNDILALGGMPAKSCIMPYPDIPRDLNRHYLRGVIDGDGCMTVRKVYRKDGTHNLWGRLSICGGERFLSELYSRVHRDIGIEGIIAPTKSRASELRFYTDRYSYMYEYLYADTDMYLPRKKALLEEYLTFKNTYTR